MQHVSAWIALLVETFLDGTPAVERKAPKILPQHRVLVGCTHHLPVPVSGNLDNLLSYPNYRVGNDTFT